MIRLLPVFVLVVCAGAQTPALPSGEVPLSKTLWEWKREMEARSHGQVILTRAFTDTKENTITLPRDIAHREVLKRYFQDPGFVAQFIQSHATTIAYQGFEGMLYFVVLNMALADQWKGLEDGVLAHEFAHIDLIGREYPSWAGGEGAAPNCLATQATDVVQHVLVREQMRQRRTSYFEFWKRNLDAVVKQMESRPASSSAADACRKYSRLALWSDVRLAFGGNTEWAGYSRFEALMRRDSPELKPVVDRIEARLRQAAIWDKERYLSALYDVYRLFEPSRPTASPVVFYE